MPELCIGNMVPGPRGRDGTDGVVGVDGLNAYTVTDADFIMPAIAATVVVTVVENGWAFAGQTVFIETAGYFTVVSKAGTTLLTLENRGDVGNAAPTTVIAAANGVSPGGVPGVDGTLTGAAGGDLTGFYPNPTVDLLKITSAKMSVTGVTAGTYGSATQIPVLSIDVSGRITSASNVAFSAAPTGAAGGDLTGTYPNPTLLVVVPTKGGTGQSTVDTGDLLYGSASNVWSRLPAVAVGNVLRSKGVLTAPAWEPVDLQVDVTNVLGAANGGTGTSVVVTGDLLYGSAPNTWSRLPSVVAGNVLISGGIGVAPAWGPVVSSSTGVSPGTANQILSTNLAATASEWRTLSGTSNQIAVAFLAGSVTLSTPQNIHTGASPTFVNLTLSGLTQSTPIIGTGGALAQDTTPAGHRLYGWNNTALDMRFITIGSGLSFDPATDILTSTGGSAVTSITLTQPAAGFTITGSGVAITSTGTPTFALADDLLAVEGIATTGYVQRTASNTWSTVTLIPLAGGGTGSALADPGGHRIMGWDDTNGDVRWFNIGANLSYDDATDTLNAAGSGGGGSVTSVGLSAPAEFSVTGSPVTISGTLALAWATQTANKVFASAVSGGAAVPTFRALVNADLPSGIDAAKIGGGGVSTTEFDFLGGVTSDIQTQLNAKGTVSSVAVTDPAAGIVVTGDPITTSGTLVIALADDLLALENLATAGVAQRTGTSTWATALGTAARLVTWSATAPYLTSVANLATYIAGTSNQVTVTDDGDGTVTLSLPQNISVGSSPTFAGLSLTGLLGEGPLIGTGSIAPGGTLPVFVVDRFGAASCLFGYNNLFDDWGTFALGSGLSFNEAARTLSATGSGGTVTGTGTVNKHAKWTASTVLGDSLLFDNGTNVGVGTVTPNEVFQVVGNLSTYHASALNGAGHLVHSYTDTTGSTKADLGMFGVTQYGASVLKGAFSVYLANTTTPDLKFQILNTGAMGLNAALPEAIGNAIYHIANPKKLKGDAEAWADVGHQTTSYAEAFPLCLSTGFRTSPTPTNRHMFLQAVELGDVTRPLILQPIGGYVGINTSTAVPSAPLTIQTALGGRAIDIVAEASGVGVLQFLAANGTTLQGGMYGATGRITMVDATSANVLSVTAGKVGIGTLSPTAALTVQSATSGVAIDLIAGSSGLGFIQFFQSNGTTAQGSIYGQTGRITITDSAFADVFTVAPLRVGILNIAPAATLDVNGTVLVSGTVTLSNLTASRFVKTTTAGLLTVSGADTITLTSEVSGILPVANGGTGAATFTDGGVLIGNGTGVVQVTSSGTTGQVLTSNGVGVDPTFQTPATSGTVNGTGTTGRLSKWISSTTLSDSIVSESGQILTLNGGASTLQTSSGALTLNGATVTSGAITCSTLNTGQGDNELYDMNQNVQTTDSPLFGGLIIAGTNGVIGIQPLAETGLGAVLLNNAALARRLELVYVGTGASSLYGIAPGGVGINAFATSMTFSTADVARLVISNAGAVTIPGSLDVTGALTKGTVAVSLVGHTHAAADIVSGTIATARLGSGSASSTTFLRGDQTWATPAGGGGSPGGPSLSVQYNDGAGGFAGSAGMTWIEATYSLKVGTAYTAPGRFYLDSKIFLHMTGGGISYTNTFVGPDAGNTSVSGTFNTAFGSSAMLLLTSGGLNDAFGAGALSTLTTGSRNVAVGAGAGDGITTGEHCVILGHAAEGSGSAAYNQIVIGGKGNNSGGSSSVVGVGDNTCTIGGTHEARTVINTNAGRSADTRAKLGGSIYNEISATGAGSTTGSETTIATYTFSSNTVGTNGDRLIVRASGIFADNANSKIVRVLVNGVELARVTAKTTVTRDTSWAFWVEIVRLVESGTQNFHIYAGANQTAMLVSCGTLTLDFTGGHTITVGATANTANNDIVRRTFNLEWHPAAA